MATAIPPSPPYVDRPYDYARDQKLQPATQGIAMTMERREIQEARHPPAGPSRTPNDSRWSTSTERTRPGKKAARGRQNSLRKVKNSTDMLRERSLQRQRSRKEAATADGGSGSREGKARQFTVANVGGGGMIYLRCVTNPVLRDASAPLPR